MQITVCAEREEYPQAIRLNCSNIQIHNGVQRRDTRGMKDVFLDMSGMKDVFLHMSGMKDVVFLYLCLIGLKRLGVKEKLLLNSVFEPIKCSFRFSAGHLRRNEMAYDCRKEGRGSQGMQ